MRVRFTRRARADLASIFGYVAAESPAAAAALVESILAVIDNLPRFPDLGRPTHPPGRRVLTLPGAPYRVFYRVDGAEIRILHVRHTSRRPLHGPS
jgi:toxin ParE1/3/4